MLGGMKRRRILLLLALAVTAAGLVLFWPRGPTEPFVEGKPIRGWLWETMTNPVTYTDINTSKTLRARATNALPYLLYQFGRPRSKWRATWNRWTSALSVRDLQFEDDERRLVIAEWGLYLLGPDAAPAVPTLVGFLGDKDRGQEAASIVAGVGDQALPWLLNAVASTNPVIAQRAMNGLMVIAQKSDSAMRVVLGLLRDTNSAVRRIAAVNLWRDGVRLDLKVPALVAALADPDAEVQSLAAQSLGEIGLSQIQTGTNAQPALPALLRLMTSTNASVASAASNAVFRIDPAALPPRGP